MLLLMPENHVVPRVVREDDAFARFKSPTTVELACDTNPLANVVRVPLNVVVPENVGESERTILPVPVTALSRVTPPYVRAFARESEPLLENVDVALEPKEALCALSVPPVT